VIALVAPRRTLALLALQLQAWPPVILRVRPVSLSCCYRSLIMFMVFMPSAVPDGLLPPWTPVCVYTCSSRAICATTGLPPRHSVPLDSDCLCLPVSHLSGIPHLARTMMHVLNGSPVPLQMSTENSMLRIALALHYKLSTPI
jgi:hypothetical protein